MPKGIKGIQFQFFPWIYQDVQTKHLDETCQKTSDANLCPAEFISRKNSIEWPPARQSVGLPTQASIFVLVDRWFSRARRNPATNWIDWETKCFVAHLYRSRRLDSSIADWQFRIESRMVPVIIECGDIYEAFALWSVLKLFVQVQSAESIHDLIMTSMWNELRGFWSHTFRQLTNCQKGESFLEFHGISTFVPHFIAVCFRWCKQRWARIRAQWGWGFDQIGEAFRIQMMEDILGWKSSSSTEYHWVQNVVLFFWVEDMVASVWMPCQFCLI